jgi:hypothetical protein
MLKWLRKDLKSNKREWVIAFWHFPPYSKGSHNSDVESGLIKMRQNALPILEAAGVDLVLCGHSHSYERSYLLDGHYGYSNTFTAANKVDGGDGREDGTGPYKKPTAGPAPHEGTVYVVAGSAAKTEGGRLTHPAMSISLNQLGSLVLDISGDRLDAEFLNRWGAVADHFTIEKGVAPTAVPPPDSPPGPPAAPTDLSVSARFAKRVELSWTDNADNENGFQIQRSQAGQPWEVIATVGTDVTNFSDMTVKRTGSYRYLVRAYNNGSYSAFSNRVTAGPK